MLFAAKSVLNITRKRQTHILENKCCAVLCDFILKCLESMRHYIPFTEITINVAVTPHIIYNEMHSSDVPKNLISYFTKSISCCLVRLARIVTCWKPHALSSHRQSCKGKYPRNNRYVQSFGCSCYFRYSERNCDTA